jgi:phosphopantothenoylcysteine decarboxylase/phosphopantothenate--cysteine ligase
MLKDKELDAVCLNILEAENNFGSDKNKVTFLTKQSTKELPLSYKEDIAAQILKLSESL